METPEQKTPMRDVLLRVVAVLGLIAVLLLGAWGIIQLAVAIPTFFSNIGGGFSSISQSTQKESLTVSAAASISSGQSLQVSWSHKNGSGEYSYAVSFACQSGLSVKAPLPTGSYQTIACNTPFNFVNATDKMTVIPSASGKSLPLALTVSATKLSSGAVTSQGTATTNVAPATVATTAVPATKAPAASKTTVSYYPAPVQKAALYGYADLAVRINSVTPAANGLTSVVFTIQNTGTNGAPAGWMFNANLPINGSYMFASQPQRAMNPGDKIVYTLTFSNPSGYSNGYANGYTGYGYSTGSYTCTGYGPCFAPSADPIDYTYGNTYNYNQPTYNYSYSNGPITITVDPQNFVWESNESNNTATAY